jgi:methyl-accepting chemotaxis protein
MTQPAADLARLLATFSLRPDDVTALSRFEDYARDRLPGLLGGLHGAFVHWPAIHKAVQDPDVHRIRVNHWARVVTGRLDADFLASAEALADAFFSNGVPGHAVAICHASVIEAITHDLGIDQDRGRRRRKADSALRVVLTKLAWFDLELLLETYSRGEAGARAAAARTMAETIERQTSAAVGQVSTLTADMYAIAAAMRGTAGRTGETASRAAANAERTRDGVQQINQAADQLAASINAITDQVSRSRTLSEVAVQSGRDAQAGIEALARQAAEIDQVARAIAEIAAKTNLLALNATIEAARAGDAGRGFAVVAGEVKGLAAQTARSTEDIARQISAIQAATTGAARRVRAMVATIGDMEQMGAAVAAAVGQQGTATGEIARTIGATTASVAAITREAREVRDAAEEGDAQAGDVQRRAQDLDTAVGGLRQAVTKAVRLSSTDVDRRSSPRHAVTLHGHYTAQDGTRVAVQTVDLSAGGALLEAAGEAPPLGPATLTLAGMTLAAQTLRRQDDGRRFAVSFQIDAAQRQQLELLIEPPAEAEAA